MQFGHCAVGLPRLRRALLAAMVALAVVAPRVAGADCAPDPDTDGDGACDPDDNCVAIANPLQEDTWGAVGVGDACETFDGELNVTKVKIRAGSTANPKGKVTAKGDFVLLASETLSPTKVAARVVDGIQLDQSTPIAGGADVLCKVSPSGRSIRCRQPEPQATVQTTVVFKLPNSPPGSNRTVRFGVKIAKLAIGGTAFMEPVTVTISDPDAGVVRVGKIEDCAATNGQLTCRES